jgi:transcriptional regulator with GAF, ATPase, and Fis domain
MERFNAPPRGRTGPEDGVNTPLSEREAASLEQLGLELSSTLVQSGGQGLDEIITDSMRRIAAALGADRCALAVYAPDGSSLSDSQVWERPGARPGGMHQLSWYSESLLRGEKVVLNTVPEDLPFEARCEMRSADAFFLKSHVAIPGTVAGQKVCVLSVDVMSGARTWSPVVVAHLTFVVEILAAAIYRERQKQSLRNLTSEVARMARPTPRSADDLDEEVDLQGFDEIVGDSPILLGALARLVEVAATDATVLLLGETGTGKEVFARALHARSHRRTRPLVRVNCGALPASLIESELFGHERGAFTGAVTSRPGRFELAHTGTLFLDEIGDLPLDLQAKLLRVLQEGEFERLGSSHTQKVDVRLIAATHHNLEAAVAEGRFRTDLFYRLNVFPIRLPPLRERPDDIPKLVWYIVHQRQRALSRQITDIPAYVMDLLQRYDWPGNVRELENLVERAMIQTTGEQLACPEGLGSPHAVADSHPGRLDHIERKHIEDVLQRCDWRINGPGNAAEMLGLHPNTLRFRMKKLGIVRPGKTAPQG